MKDSKKVFEDGAVMFPARTELYKTIEQTEKTVNLSLLMRLLKPAYQEEVAKMLLHRIYTGVDPHFSTEPLAIIYTYLVDYVLAPVPKIGHEEEESAWHKSFKTLTHTAKKLFTF